MTKYSIWKILRQYLSSQNLPASLARKRVNGHLRLTWNLHILRPPLLDFKRIQSLIQTRIREWEDYGWTMREDPSFFADVVGDWSEHSSEQIPAAGTRKPHPDLASAALKRMFWYRTISSVTVL